MPWTYILRCADDTYYVGSTFHLERRIQEHNEGLGAEYTRRRRPVTLAWAGEFARIDEAFAFEKRVQGWGRRKREALIAGELDRLRVLSSRSRRAKALRDDG